jgi:hypothetical protein
MRATACSVVALAVLTQALLAQEGISRGTIKKVDADKRSVTITSEGKDIDLDVFRGTRFMDASGQPIQNGLRHQGFKAGAPVMFKTAERDGKTVLFGIRIAGPNANQQPPPKVDMSAVKPLSDMAKGQTYHGFEGGLYPGGENARPADHESAGLTLAQQVQPLDRDGRPSTEGKIVLLAIGMSNTNQAFQGFKRVARGDNEINPQLVLVNGAQGGMTAKLISNAEGGRPQPGGQFVRYWDEVDNALNRADVTRAQVQAVWIKQTDAGPDQGFPAYAETLQQELARIVQIVHERFPSAKLAYLSSRTYGGFAKTRLNPEPYAYESGFAVKWLIAQQLKGDSALNHDPKRGPVKAPWLSWGPNLWADGTTKRADGFSYDESDFTPADGTHESPQGQEKVGRLLLQFFKTDSTTKPWFLHK